MVWIVQWSEKSIKQLKKLNKKQAKIIRNRVVEIRHDPYSAVRRLANVQLYSLRVGQYRVILDLKREQLIVFAVSISKRSHAYDRLD